MARGQKPPIHSPVAASQFRDPGNAEICTMASFMFQFETDLDKMLGDVAYEKTLQTWRSGLLDSKLLPEIQATRPDFNAGGPGPRSAVPCGGCLPLNFVQDEAAGILAERSSSESSVRL